MSLPSGYLPVAAVKSFLLSARVSLSSVSCSAVINPDEDVSENPSFQPVVRKTGYLGHAIDI